MNRYFKKLNIAKFIFVMIVSYVVLIGGAVIAAFFPNRNIESYLTVAFYVILFSGFFLFSLDPEDREAIFYEDERERKPWSLAFVPFFIMGFTTIIYVLILETLFPKLFDSFMNAPNILEGLNFGENPVTFILLFISIVLLAPVVEEIVFRGILFNLLNKKRGLIFSMIVSSVFFGVLHAETMIPTTVIGFVLCFIYQKTGSLKLSIAGHMFNNLVAFLLPFLIENMTPESTAYLILNGVLFFTYAGITLYFISYMVKNKDVFREPSPIYRVWGE
ncbi:MAG: type II CAAX endopeptidase family protein [Clostridiaceae bacterium]